jgi:hypothetical protein
MKATKAGCGLENAADRRVIKLPSRDPELVSG